MQIEQNKLSFDKVTVSIIGGTGGMGKLFARVFRKYLKVVICSRNFHKAKKTAKRLKISAWPLEECNKADIVLVSIPIEETYKVCKEVSKKMKKDSLLIEISSVKSGIADRLSKDLNEKSLKYLSLHLYIPIYFPELLNHQ